MECPRVKRQLTGGQDLNPPRKNVLMIHTGGTIGMWLNPDTGYYEPKEGWLQQLLDGMPELSLDSMPTYDLLEYWPLLDSSNMQPSDWLRIATDIFANYASYDAFVVLHGTDTMAYTASALSFMLKHLGKLVIITGSQIPLMEPRNDARMNLIASMEICQSYAALIPEVTLLFGTVLLRGNRATKANSTELAAFESPNFPPIGNIDVEIDIVEELLLAKPTETLVLEQIDPDLDIGIMRFFPGMKAEVVSGILAPPLVGFVAQGFGVGNGPSNDTALMDTFKVAHDRGATLIDVTQCFSGSVNLETYETGNAMKDAGFISGYDLTTEGALTKLFYVLSNETDPVVIETMMKADLRGELTSPDTPVDQLRRMRRLVKGRK